MKRCRRFEGAGGRQARVHSAATADRRVGIQLTEEQLKRAHEVVHPMVRTHPLSGEKSLYFSLNHTARIDGISEEDSLDLFEELRAHATKPEFVYAIIGGSAIWFYGTTPRRCTAATRSPTITRG